MHERDPELQEFLRLLNSARKLDREEARVIFDRCFLQWKLRKVFKITDPQTDGAILLMRHIMYLQDNLEELRGQLDEAVDIIKTEQTKTGEDHDG